MQETESGALRARAQAPPLSRDGGIVFWAEPDASAETIDLHSPVIQCLNTTFDLAQFKSPRRPFSLGVLPADEAALLNADLGAPRVTDMPVRMPGSPFRVPRELAQVVPVLKRSANFERRINLRCFDEYYCYVTFQQGWVLPGKAQRPSPCHVDGFQGARWRPKRRCNHSYTIASELPTMFFEQPIDLDALDDSRHNFFLEMDRQVSITGGAHAWQPQPNELVLMDCYCVHHGAVATIKVWRTFVRISWEVRIFDHVDNTHNPLFLYDWPLADRHIQGLNLVAWTPPTIAKGVKG
jgi:hypothetical protein